MSHDRSFISPGSGKAIDANGAVFDITGGVDIMMTVQATASDATAASISAGFDIVLKDD